MDTIEKFACVMMLGIGAFLTSYPLIPGDHKIWILFGIGLLFVGWATYALARAVRESYKIVKI